MDNPPPSPRESNQQLSCNEESRQPNTLSASYQINTYTTRSASGTNEYTGTGHKTTISNCATNASGPSTSQTWLSGPGTFQMTSTQPMDASSQADTSIQNSARIMPVEVSQPTLVSQQQQQMMENSTMPVRVTSTTSQQQQTYTSTSYGQSLEDQKRVVVHPGEIKSLTNTAQSSEINNPSNQQQWTISKTSALDSATGQPVTTTQWIPDSFNDQTKSQFSQPKQTTRLTAYTAGQTTTTSDGAAQSGFKTNNDQAKDFYNKAFTSYQPIEQVISQAPRQMSSTSIQENTGQIMTTSSIVNTNQQQSGSAMGMQEPQQVSETVRTVTGEPRETVRTISSHLDYSNQKVSENVVRREYGEARVVSTSEHRLDGKAYVKSERFINHEVKVPKRVTREQITERVVVEHETKIVEEIVQDTCMVKEKVIEWARPRIVDKVVEQPEIIHEEVTINVIETIARPRIIHRDVPVQQIQEVVKPVIVERPVDQIITERVEREVPHEVIKYVDDIQNVVVPKEVQGPPQVVEVPQPNVVQKESMIDVQREIPVPVEADLVCQVEVPEIRPRYKKIAYPVYLPKFIEVPMAVDLMTEALQSESTEFVSKINGFTKTAASLCDIENLASNIMRMDHGTTAANLMSSDNLQAAVAKVWEQATSTTTTTTTTTGANRVGQYNVSAASMGGGSSMISTTAGGITNTSSTVQYMPSQYVNSQNMKNELSQSLVAVS